MVSTGSSWLQKAANAMTNMAQKHIVHSSNKIHSKKAESTLKS